MLLRSFQESSEIDSAELLQLIDVEGDVIQFLQSLFKNLFRFLLG